MVKLRYYFKMGSSMRVTLETVKEMQLVSITMQMEIFTMVNGKMTNETVRVD